MLLKDGINELISRRKTDSNSPQIREIYRQKINLVYKEVYRAHQWEYRKRTGGITLIPNYTTGTCAITQYNGSNESAARTVTFTGATLVASMKGRYFQPQGGSSWYKIISVDTSGGTITLETPIVEDTASGLTFKIWKRFYYLYSDVDVLLEMGRWVRDQEITQRQTLTTNDITNHNPEAAEPEFFSTYGVDPLESAYSTGTITIANDSDTVTGTGTAWLEQVGPGDLLRTGTATYRIKRVESDTSLILWNAATSAVSGATYAISKDNPLGFQFYSASDSYFYIPYSYYGKAYDLVNEDYDRTQLPEAFDACILDGAEAMRMKDNSDANWVAQLQVYQARLEGLKAKSRVTAPRYRQFAPNIPTRMPGRG